MTILHDQWTALYAAGRVRWMAGMLTQHGRVVTADVAANGVQMPLLCVGTARLYAHGPTTIIPDFTDPATIGCLLHQARDAWDDKGLTVVGEFVPPFDPSWRVMGQSHHGVAFQRLAMIGHDSEPAAILAAIAAAPPKVSP